MPIRGFLSEAGTPTNPKKYVQQAVEKLKNAPESDLEAWSKEICDQVPSSGFESVVKENLLDIATMSFVHPEKIISDMKKWMQADQSIQPLLSDSGDQPHHTLYGLRGADPEAAAGAATSFEDIVEQDNSRVKCTVDEEFRNWGDTVSSVPKYTFFPKTSTGVQNIVNHFKGTNARIRAGGTRHSWTDIYNTPKPRSNTTQVFLSLVEKGTAIPGKFGTFVPNEQGEGDLERIELINVSGSSATVRLGSAVTSEHFRQWALDKNGGAFKWMISALPVLTAITSGGWTQPICHGSGIQHKTVSDICVRLEIINCKGNRQVIDDLKHLKAASGAFGLLGIVINQDFRLDPFKLSVFQPRLFPTLLSVPPIEADDVPGNAREDFDTKEVSTDDLTEEKLKEAADQLDTEANKFYSEWFWFPFQKNCWLNNWDTAEHNAGDPVPQYPDEGQIIADNVQAALGATLENTVFSIFPFRNFGKLQATLTAQAALLFLPNEDDYPDGSTFLPSNVPDTLHFRRGIHRMPVRNCEFAAEIPALGEGLGPDMTIVRKLWWVAINAVYKAEAKGEFPMRTTLEMRMVGGSDVLMSTQKGNDFTCAIEVLSNTIVSDEEWLAFINDLATQWKTVLDQASVGRSSKLQFRPHWAKEWPTVIDGEEIIPYLKRVYKKQIPLFLQEMDSIGAAATDGTYTANDALGLFGNETLLAILGRNPPGGRGSPVGPSGKKNRLSKGCFCVGRQDDS